MPSAKFRPASLRLPSEPEDQSLAGLASRCHQVGCCESRSRCSPLLIWRQALRQRFLIGGG